MTTLIEKIEAELMEIKTLSESADHPTDMVYYKGQEMAIKKFLREVKSASREIEKRKMFYYHSWKMLIEADEHPETQVRMLALKDGLNEALKIIGRSG